MVNIISTLVLMYSHLGLIYLELLSPHNKWNIYVTIHGAGIILREYRLLCQEMFFLCQDQVVKVLRINFYPLNFLGTFVSCLFLP